MNTAAFASVPPCRFIATCCTAHPRAGKWAAKCQVRSPPHFGRGAGGVSRCAHGCFLFFEGRNPLRNRNVPVLPTLKLLFHAPETTVSSVWNNCFKRMKQLFQAYETLGVSDIEMVKYFRTTSYGLFSLPGQSNGFSMSESGCLAPYFGDCISPTISFRQVLQISLRWIRGCRALSFCFSWKSVAG